MKIIFVPVSDRPECMIALHQGFSLAQQTNSHVVGCHFRPHSESEINLPGDPDDSMVVVDSYDLAWEAALRDSSVEDGDVKAKSLFEKMAQQYSYELLKKPNKDGCALWKEKVGSPDRLFSIAGPLADLLVVSRPIKKGRSLAHTIMMSAVLYASSPVLVLPQHEVKTPGKRICIAWNQSTEAALAVKAAMPLLQQAAMVTILTSGEDNQLGPKAKHLEDYLKAWQLNTQRVHLKEKSDTQAILNGYNQTESDLLVMGGYSRSRLRQRIFGGVTEYMLNSADIPVFILHT